VEGEAEEAAGSGVGVAVALDDGGPAGLAGLVLGENPIPGEVGDGVGGDARARGRSEREGRDVADDGVGAKGCDGVRLAVGVGFPVRDECAVGCE
jgi:hypothetical protein